MSRREPSKRRPPAKRGSSAKRSQSAKKPARKKTTAKKSAARKATPKKTAPRKRAPASGPPEPLRTGAAAALDTQWSFREMVKRFNLRERPTQIAVASIVVILALVAAILVWPSSEDDTSKLASGGTAETTQDEADAGSTQSGPSAGGGISLRPGSGEATDEIVENPFGDEAQSRKIGELIRPQSTSLPNGNPNTWPGVTKDTIKLVFAYDATSCGVNTLTLAQQAGANLQEGNRYYRGTPNTQEKARAEYREAAQALIQVVNKRALEAAEPFPHIRKLMGNDPTRPFFGRKLIYELVDGGSYQCPETTTAAAVKIVDEIKPFVVINDDALSRSAYNMAAALNAKAPPDRRPMHFGTLQESDSLYKKWAPFSWTQFSSGTNHVRQYASWLCSRVAGKKAVNSAQYKGQTRKFALMYPNFQQVRGIANELKGFVKQYCGRNVFATEFAYDTDPSRATDQGTQIAVRFKLDGITSVVYLLDLVAPIFHLISMEGQDYKPEFVFTGTNYMDSSVVQRTYEQPMVDKASFGITNFGVPGGFGYEAGDPFYAWHDLHKKSPNSGKACDPDSDAGMNHDEAYCKAPSALVTLYYSTLALLGGLLFAGPDLTPLHVTKGLQAYPRTRFGGAGATTDPRPGLVGAAPGQYFFAVDATEWRWRSSFISPPPESKLGWVEYPDCMRHYMLWPDQLAVDWERDGPNYNVWCGNEKYAPKPYEPTGEPSDTCADTPSGKCEKNNYPPWGPTGYRPS
jgi:hypothetical protein